MHTVVVGVRGMLAILRAVMLAVLLLLTFVN
jgi:hypothetical protein